MSYAITSNPRSDANFYSPVSTSSTGTTDGASSVGPGNNADGTQTLAPTQDGTSTNTAAQPSGGEVPSDPTEADARVKAAVDQLMTSGFGDDMEFLARALIEMNGQQRREALSDRMTARQTAMNDLLTQAASMTKEAKNMLKNAITTIVVGAVASVASMVGSIGSAVQEVKGLGKIAHQESEQVGKEMAMANRTGDKALNEEAAASNLRSKGSVKMDDLEVEGEASPTVSTPKTRNEATAERYGKLSETLGDLKSKVAKEKKIDVTFAAFSHAGDLGRSMSRSIEGVGDSQNKTYEADQKVDEARSQVDSNREDQYKSIQDNLADTMTTITNFIHDYQEAKSEGMAAWTRG